MTIGPVLSVFGWLFCGFWILIAVFIPFSEQESIGGAIGGIIFCIVLAAGGFFLSRYGKRLTDATSRTRQYLEMIVIREMSSIDNIASELGQCDLNQVMNEIQQTIYSNHLHGYVVDRQLRIVSRPRTQEKKPLPANVHLISFKCTACGANNEEVVASGTIRCEYCEAPAKL